VLISMPFVYKKHNKLPSSFLWNCNEILLPLRVCMNSVLLKWLRTLQAELLTLNHNAINAE
jgi:hypothetical protein